MSTREDLETGLRALAAGVEWPPTPDVAPRVRARVEREPRRRRALAPWPLGGARLRPAVAVPALLALVVAVTAAVPPARSAVLELLGLAGGERVVRTPTAPSAPPRPPATGERVSLERARTLVRFPVAVPALLGAPGDVRYARQPAGGAVSLHYGDRHVLTQAQGQATPFAQKLVGPQTAAHEVRVAGVPGLWLTGAPHVYVQLDRNGVPVELTARLVDANVLLWDRGGVAHRLETRGRLREALAIAASLRPSG